MERRPCGPTSSPASRTGTCGADREVRPTTRRPDSTDPRAWGRAPADVLAGLDRRYAHIERLPGRGPPHSYAANHRVEWPDRHVGLPWCGRRDLNPHFPCGKTDFRTHPRLSPPLVVLPGFGVWTIPSPCPDLLRVSGAARLVSTPSRSERLRTGLARDRHFTGF